MEQLQENRMEFQKLKPADLLVSVYQLAEPVNLPFLSSISACEEIVRQLAIGSTEFKKRSSILSPRLRLKTIPETLENFVPLLVLFSIPYSLKRPAHVSWDILDRWANKRQKLTLPSTRAELQILMNAPLRDDEKIPLRPNVLDELVRENIKDPLKPEDVSALFRSSEVEEAISLFSIFFTAVFHPPPAQHATEDAYHSFWDRNIRGPIEVLVPFGQTVRNSSEHTATRKLRPDFCYLLDGRCPFRGEETALDNHEDPKYELSRKFDWDYGEVPYLLGYYCRATVLTLVAIMRPEGANDKPNVQDLATVDLRTRQGRIKNLLWLINLSCLFQDLVNLMPRREAEYLPEERDNCILELTAHHVIKRYTCRDALQKIRHLQTIYQLLDDKKVPNTDSIYYTSGNMVILHPRGHREMPKTEKELLDAIFCILKVLEAIHPSLIHRDIRWPNVIRRKHDPSQWFLVDWEDASEAPAPAVKHFASSTHSPRVFQDGHGAEVDIWGVGHLIMESWVEGLSPKLRQIGVWMKESSPSVKEVQERLMDFENK